MLFISSDKLARIIGQASDQIFAFKGVVVGVLGMFLASRRCRKCNRLARMCTAAVHLTVYFLNGAAFLIAYI